MNEMVSICGTDIQFKEYQGQRVVTFKDIDAVHHRPNDDARKSFNRNRKHFIEGEDYFIVRPGDKEKILMGEFHPLENKENSLMSKKLTLENSQKGL